MPREEWLPVAGYEGLYEVSSLGNIRSLDRYCLGKDGRAELHHGKVLYNTPGKRGYVTVHLRDALGRCRRRSAHSVVAEAFLGARPAGHDILHLNGRRTDNRVANLRYGSRAENLHQTYEYGGRAGPGKLDAKDVKDIRKLVDDNVSDVEIARLYGVHRSAIYRIRKGINFKWLREEGGK